MYRKLIVFLAVGIFSIPVYSMIGDVVGAATGAARGALGAGEAAVGAATGTASQVVEPAPAPVVEEPSVAVEPTVEAPAIETTERDLLVEEDTMPATEPTEDVDLTTRARQEDMTEMPEVSTQDQDTGIGMSAPDISDTDEY